MGLFRKGKNNKTSVPTGLVTTTRMDPIAVIRLNNAANQNIFTKTLIHDLTTAFESITNNDDVRCIILAAEGQNFSGGPSLEELVSFDIGDARKYWSAGKRLMDAVEMARQPVICAIQGQCISIGLSLALASDIRLMSEDVRLSFPDIKHLGLLPCWGATKRLPHIIGSQDATFMLLTGKQLTADDAINYGLALKVLERSELESEARELAQQIASSPTHALALTKRTIKECIDLEYGASMSIEEHAFISSWNTPDRTDIIKDAINKRKKRL